MITSPIPSQSTQSSHLTGLSPEALLEQLGATLHRFDSLSVAPPKVRNERALWFHPHEFKGVNQIWEKDGIETVVSKWGEARTFASGLPVSLAQKPSMISSGAPENAIVLLVFEFGAPTEPDPAQLSYFRSCNFELPEVLQSEILRTLTESDLLSKLIPAFDTATETTLKGAPITEISCSSEWYGPDNIYGEGSNFKISLRISPPEKEPVCVCLRIDSDGCCYRRLWCASFAETGYEGHDHTSVTPTTEELRAIIPIIARVSEVPPQQRNEDRVGSWYGNSLATLPASALV